MKTGWARLATAVTLVIGVAACTGGRDNRAASNSRGESTGTTARSNGTSTTTLAELAANPGQYDGQHVTVRANVSSAIGQTAFTVTDASAGATGSAGSGTSGTSATGAGSSGSTILVLSPSGAPSSDRHDLTITGKVRTFISTADLQNDAPWLSSNASTAGLEQYRNRPVIVADSIMTADGRDLMGTGALPAGSGELNGTSGSSTSGSGGTEGRQR